MMQTKADRSPRRRTYVASAVVLAILVAFVVRLVDIQVVNASALVSDSMRMSLAASQQLYGTRGPIVDRGGNVLARSVLLYDAQLDPSNVGAVERTGQDGEPVEVPWPEIAEEIGEITGQKGSDIEALVTAALEENPDSQYALLKRGLTTDQYRQLQELGVPFLHFTRNAARTYPNGAVAGNLIGFISSDGTPLAGFEKTGNACLAAEDGLRTYQTGADGVMIPGSEKVEPAVDGGTLKLTIDADLQWYMQQLIAEQVNEQRAQWGSIIVAEVDSGEILAAAEYPSVDPNAVGKSPPEDRGSRIFRFPFEPGSTFKPLTAAAVMEVKGITPTSSVTAPSHEVFPNGAVINDPFVHPVYQYTLAGALIDSSNVSMSKFGTMIDRDVRHDFYEKFGIGSVTDVGFLGEDNGLLHPAEDWDNQTLYTTTFGQGLTVTAPQMVGAYQAIANDGVKLPLHIVDSCTSADGEVTEPELSEPRRVISEKVADQVQLMVENVAVQSGISSLIEIPGYRVAAKTGTAQKPAPGGGYKKGVYFTSIIGFAPAEDPQYVVMVTLDEPLKVRSSTATAPGFQKAMTQTLKSYRVMPSSSELDELLPKFAE